MAEQTQFYMAEIESTDMEPTASVREPISDEALGALIQTELNQSGNWAGGEFREAIKDSLNYFLLKQKGDEVPGRNQMQSGDVANMVDHVQAEIQPMYNVETLCEVGEEGPDDQSADQETKALNWYWRERLRGAERLDEAVQDAVLSRNGYLKVWYEESYGLPYMQELVGDELQVQVELQKLSEENELELIEGDLAQEPVYAELAPAAQNALIAMGVEPPVIEISPAVYEVEVKVTPLYKEVKLDSVAPEDSFVSRDAVGSDMQRPRFWAQRRRMTRQDIKALGFWAPDVDKMTIASDYNEDVKNERQADDNTYYRIAADKDGQMVDLFECYYKVDRDRDGVPELWKVFTSNTGQILHWDDDGYEGDTAAEMVRVRPVASGSPMKVSHRHQGRSLYDKLKDSEDWGRLLKRQLADNLVEANNVTTRYDEAVNPEDIEETEVGRSIIGAPGSVEQMKHNNIVGDSLSAIAYQKEERHELAGTSTNSGRENMPVQQAAHSTERIMSAMERVVGMYAQNIANNLIRDTFVLLHEQMKLLPGKVSFKDGSNWAETEPRYWIQRNRISINLGLSDGEKMRRGAALGKVIANQRADKTEGPVLSMEEYEARIDEARMAGLSDPEQYYLNPESPEAQQKAAMAAQQAQEDRQIQLAQSAALINSQKEMVAMQEQTKRMSDQLDAMDNERDRLAKLIESMTKLEVENAVKLPFGLADEEAPAGLVGSEAMQ